MGQALHLQLLTQPIKLGLGQCPQVAAVSQQLLQSRPVLLRSQQLCQHALNGTAAHTLFVQLLKYAPGFVDLAGTLEQPGASDLNGFEMLRITLPGMTKITISRLKIASLLCRVRSSEILQ